MTVTEADGFSPEVAVYIKPEPGPLAGRLADVCTRLAAAVGQDTNLQHLPIAAMRSTPRFGER